MADAQRHKLPTPERTAPHRSFVAAARAGDPAQSAPSKTESDAGHAVGLGYQVIDEYLKEGRRIAAGIGSPFAAMGVTGLQAISERLLKDGLLWLEAIARLSTPAAPRGSGATTVGLTTCVVSRRPTELVFRLNPGATARPLAAHPLHAPGQGAQAALNVELSRDESGDLRVGISVPDDVPKGNYTGVVYDQEDGTLRGTIEVRVEASSGT